MAVSDWQALRNTWADTKRCGKPFQCIETGEVFQTQIEAHRRSGVDRKSLRLALAGNYKQAGGYHWQYIGGFAVRTAMNVDR